MVPAYDCAPPSPELALVVVVEENRWCVLRSSPPDNELDAIGCGAETGLAKTRDTVEGRGREREEKLMIRQ